MSISNSSSPYYKSKRYIDLIGYRLWLPLVYATVLSITVASKENCSTYTMYTEYFAVFILDNACYCTQMSNVALK